MRLQTSLRLKRILQASLMMLAMVISAPNYSETENDISEPEVIIKQTDSKKISEYYVNGVLVEIKVEPKNAPTYYLIPAENGQMVRTDESQLLIPTWKILEW